MSAALPVADRYVFGDGEHVALRMAECTAPHLREAEKSDAHFADQDEEPSDARAACTFLRALHPSGYRDLRALHATEPAKTVSLPADDLSGVENFATQYADRNVYVGVATRRTADIRSTEGCAALYALFADIDFRDSSEEAARARLAAFPLNPSIIINSGGGLQAYWLLTHPLDLQQSGGVAEAKRLLRALADALGADPSAAEVARILRIPGTRNYKYTPPRDVVIEVLDTSRMYALADLRAVLPDLTPPMTAPSVSTTLPPTIPKGQQHRTLVREACKLRRMGWEAPEIADSLWSLHRHRSEGPDVPQERADVDAIAEDIARRYAPADDPFPLSEAGDAEFFASVNADSVRFDHRQGRWLVLEETSGIWLPDRDGTLTTLALDAVRLRQRLALNIPDTDKRQKALVWTCKSESHARLTNLLTLAQDLPPLAHLGDDWDTLPHLLGTPEGVVDLRTGELRRGRPDEKISMRTRATYDPEAESPLWTRVLEEVFPYSHERTWLQNALGYSTTGAMNLDKWFLPNGEKGRNGKGTVFGAIATALGEYAKEIDGATFDIRTKTPYNLAQLPGKRFVHCSEAGSATRLNHERVKQITGGDPVCAADKYQRSFEFCPCCKLWFTCNDRPKVSDESAAFWARVIVVRFGETFLGREDTSIRDALRQDPQHQRAVLRWLVDGARRFYQQQGLGMLPPAFANATKEFQRENERIDEFVAQRCEEVENERTKASELWTAYRTFVAETGVRYPLTSKRFYQSVANRFTKKDLSTGVVYEGVRLVPEPPPLAEGPAL